MIRKQNTEDLLEESLKDLLKQMPFEKITVDKIVHNCSSTRTTFYRHFKDKYELANRIYFRKVDEFFDRHPYQENESSENYIRACYQHACDVIYDNRDIFCDLVSYRGQNSFSDFLYHYCSDYATEIMKRKAGTEQLPGEVSMATELYFSGATQLLINWILSGCTESPESVTDVMCSCIPPVISQYLH